MWWRWWTGGKLKRSGAKCKQSQVDWYSTEHQILVVEEKTNFPTNMAHIPRFKLGQRGARISSLDSLVATYVPAMTAKQTANMKLRSFFSTKSSSSVVDIVAFWKKSPSFSLTLNINSASILFTTASSNYHCCTMLSVFKCKKSPKMMFVAR